MPDVVNESADAMRSEYGFTLADLREVCGGLLDIGTADQVTRLARAEALASIHRSTWRGVVIRRVGT